MTKYKIYGLNFDLTGKCNINIEFILEKNLEMLDEKVDSIIIIYDITNRSSFEKCNYYLYKLKKTKEKAKIILVGNKIDLEEKRNVPIKEAKNFSDLNNIFFFEVSCKRNKNITEVIKVAIIDYIKKLESKEIEKINNEYKLENLEKSKRNYLNYHIIININSILSLNNKGWEIKYPLQKEEYKKKMIKPCIIIGALGNRNKGKSFILSKIIGYQIENSISQKTEGISVFFGDNEDDCIALLDSGGQDDPLLKPKEYNYQEEGQNNLLEKCLKDKFATKRFLEDFIIYTSDIIIYVVEDITLNEQMILTRIKYLIKKLNKYLFVIHNLKNYQYKYEVEDYLENTLKKLYGIELIDNNFLGIRDYYNKYFLEKDSRVIHLLFINDYCEVSNYYNIPTIKFLREELEVVKNRTNFSVIEKWKEFFLKVQSNFIEEFIKRKLNLKKFCLMN